MSDIKQYIQTLLAGRQITIAQNRTVLFDEFVQDEVNENAVKQILENQKMLMDKWQLKNRIADIIQQQVSIPNGTVGKPYEAKIDFIKLGWNDVVFYELKGLELLGLQHDVTTELLTGMPTQSGDLEVILKFRVEGEAEDSVLNEKRLVLIINPDPKSLWKIKESKKEDPYWKEDNVSIFDKLGNKHIAAASKRGRSHANAGSFRDDDFAYKYFENTGWSVVAVADGAGSAKLSRQGSKIACSAIIEFFAQQLTTETDSEFELIVTNYRDADNEENQKKLSHFIYNNLSKAPYYAYQQLGEAATKAEAELKDFNTTLIFTLFKKYDVGYALLSFGVGDCPIAVINKDVTEVKLMNWLDVGEFGGGTRFITMQEIFKSEKFSTRFRFKLIDDFSYLIMMTDGIYDAKFVVEANLEKIEKWKEFLEDLQGNNEDNIKLQFDKANDELASQLSTWMDFWSVGNHDDRTLAIVF